MATDQDRLSFDLRRRSTATTFLESSVAALIFLIAFCGNSLICLLIYKKRNLRTIHNYYIASLAISDILLSLLVLPVGIGTAVAGEWLFGPELCQLQGFLTPCLAYVSILTISLTAVNRYFKIVRPRSFRRYFTPKNTARSIASAWLLAFVGPIPYVAQENSFIFHPGKLICAFDLVEVNILYTSLAGIGYFLVPATIIVFCYWSVFRVVKTNEERFAVPRPRRDFCIMRNEIRITKTLFIILLAFAACYVQVIVVELLGSVVGQFALPRQVYVFYFYMASISSAINPIIYGILNPSVHNELKKLCCKNGVRVEGSRKENARRKSLEMTAIPTALWTTW